MATTDLLFSQSPVTDLTTALVFGDEGAPVVVPTQPVTTALVFSESAATGSPVSLVFGAEAPVDTTVTELTLDGTLAQPPLTGLFIGGPITDYRIDGTLAQPPLTAAFDLRVIATLDFFALLPDPPLVGDIEALYVTNTHRPTVGQTENEWQTGSRTTQAGVAQGHQDSGSAPAGWAAFWSKTLGIGDTIVEGLPYALRPTPVNQDTRFEQGTPARTGAGFKHQDATRTRTGSDGKHQDATPRRSDTFFKHQDGDRTARATISTQWQVATHLTQARGSSFQVATDHPVGWLARHQDAMRPPAGFSVVIVVPPQPDYTPNPHLLFEFSPGTLDLVFGGGGTRPSVPGDVELVIVPVKRVYIVINNASLRRVDGNIHIPTFSMSLNLDVDSWTWGFSASLPAEALSSIEPASNGAPVEVEAMVNGVAYRALVESVSRSRSFGKASISVQGRGKTALLDSPYSPTSNFTNGQERTAQQIMGDVLSVNGVSMGWAVDWGITDWVIPTNVFSHQGSYMSALNAIAGAAGAYIQPHASANQLRVLPRYPSVPWAWGDVTPDFELPAAVTVNEGIAWTEKARYNRVFVSGVQQGVLGQVTRTGTAGDILAPMVTDALITHADAARQRGLSVLANTGRQANITLKLPVLPETGIITPGKFVRYVDGATTRIGIVRSVGVEVASPEIFQTLGVETHVN